MLRTHGLTQMHNSKRHLKSLQELQNKDNHLEGFHNALNKKAGGSYKNFFQFINLLKIQQEKFENKLIVLDSGSSAKKQQLKYR